jgi:hypothetical protein
MGVDEPCRTVNPMRCDPIHFAIQQPPVSVTIWASDRNAAPTAFLAIGITVPGAQAFVSLTALGSLVRGHHA